MVVRNEALRLPYVLGYHRGLGVARFLVVDNGSTDGTLPYLLSQPDVLVWHTDASFQAARCGTDWTEALLTEHGVGRWCLVLDADELLCYADSERRTLPALCRELDEAGHRAFSALLLDMYSEGPIRDAHYASGQDPREVCPFFDRQVYHARTNRFPGHAGQWSYFGGARQRVFGGQAPGGNEANFYCLNKVPLFRYEPSVVVSENFHWLAGPPLAAETGCLLHFKYISTFPARVIEEARRQEHWNGAAQYVRYAEVLHRDPNLTLFDPGLSLRYRDSRQLVELGIMGRQAAAPAAPLVTRESALDPAEPASPDTRGPTLPSRPSTLTRQVRDLIRTHRAHGAHPHETGVRAVRDGRFAAAVAAFQDAIALNPAFPWSHHNLGEALAQLDRLDEAAAAYRRAIELNPLFARSHGGLGDVLLRQGRWEEAVAAYRRALELQPDLPAAARGAAQALIRLAQAHFAEAGRWLRRANALEPADDVVVAAAMEIQPADPELCLELGDSLAAQGRATRAVFFYQLAHQQRPEDPRPLLRLAAVLRHTHDIEHALACCQRAIEIAPNASEGRQLLGDLLATLGRIEEAAAEYRCAADHADRPGPIFKALGDLLARLGRVDEASDAYRRAVETEHTAY